MLKQLFQLVLQQSFEIWIWWQVVILLLNKSSSSYSESELFWYYMTSFFLTTVAMATVYLPLKYRMQKNSFTRYNNQISWKMPNTQSLIVGLLVICLTIYIFYQGKDLLFRTFTEVIFPLVPLALILAIFLYKIIVFWVIRMSSAYHQEVEGIAGRMVWQLSIMIMIFFLLVSFSPLFPNLLTQNIFLAVFVPVSLFVDFAKIYYEQKGKLGRL